MGKCMYASLSLLVHFKITKTTISSSLSLFHLSMCKPKLVCQGNPTAASSAIQGYYGGFGGSEGAQS